MEPIKFKQQNVTYAENQEEYLPLPAFKTKSGRVITCWKLSDEELEEVNKTGIVWLDMLTFNKPLQPVGIGTANPFIYDDNLAFEVLTELSKVMERDALESELLKTIDKCEECGEADKKRLKELLDELYNDKLPEGGER